MANQSFVCSPSILTEAGSDELLLRLYWNSKKTINFTNNFRNESNNMYLTLSGDTTDIGQYEF